MFANNALSVQRISNITVESKSYVLVIMPSPNNIVQHNNNNYNYLIFTITKGTFFWPIPSITAVGK